MNKIVDDRQILLVKLSNIGRLPTVLPYNFKVKLNGKARAQQPIVPKRIKRNGHYMCLFLIL